MLVGFVRASKTAERFCDWAISASRSAWLASASMSNLTSIVAEAVADVGVGAEDAVQVHGGLDVAYTEPQLDAALLGDGGDARREAAAEGHEDVLRRRDAVVLGREQQRVVGVVG